MNLRAICRSTFTAALMVFLTSVASADDARDWTSSNGKHSFKATFVKVEGDLVHLKDASGKTIKVDIKKLSDADQAFLEKLNSPSEGEASPNSSRLKLDKSDRDKLEPFGVKVGGGELVLVDGKKLSRALIELGKSKKGLRDGDRSLAKLLSQKLQGENTISQLRILNVQLNAELAKTTSVQQNNRLIGAINANTSKMELINSGLERLEKQIKANRIDLSKGREQYIQEILNLRKQSDGLDTKINELNDNEEFKKTISEIETSTGQTIVLGESKSLVRSRSKLSSIEDTILSESLPLRNDGSGTFHVTVMINEQPLDMVLDSGASIILLTQANADELGIVVSADTPTIIMTIADGSEIPAKYVKLGNVRIGKFSVENVECAVLGAKATNAEPLLGMSYLSNFKFEINAAESTLNMVTIESEK